MNITGRLLTWLFRLPPAKTKEFGVTRNLQIPMADGVMLLADLYTPRANSGETKAYPTILVRSPYGRGGLFGAMFAVPFAERGYQVLIQSCRGTGGSGGEFVFARNEHADGLATLEWVKKQTWFSGELAMIGASYLGFVQWAIAAYAGPELKALVPFVTTSDFNHFRYQGGSLTLETILGWSTMMTETATTGMRFKDIVGQAKRRRLLEQAYSRFPLKEADLTVIGKSSQTFRDTLEYSPDDPYWEPVDFSATVKDVNAPVNLVAGWYDLFLGWQLKDYQTLRQAGKQPYLLIGPWYHGEFKSFGASIKESLSWLDAHLKNDRSGLRQQPVRLFVMGSKKWRDFADFPPPAKEQRWYLQPKGGLATSLPPVSDPDTYCYNPVDPTPTVGGNSLGVYMGAKDNREVETRADVLVYTGEVLSKDLEVIGPVRAELYLRSSLEYTDFFVRLCVVEASGKSVNLCDGLVRLTPGSSAVSPDGIIALEVDLWATAYHFRQGERLRIQISSGAHPRFPRNPGSGEKLGAETTLKLAEQTIFHDPNHPSAIILPVTNS
jgi:uncharacterized protein